MARGSSPSSSSSGGSLLWLLLPSLGSLCYHKVYGITVQTANSRVTAREFDEAFLSCKHSARKEVNARVEWKKVLGSDVSFVYFDGAFVGSHGGASICRLNVDLSCIWTEFEALEVISVMVTAGKNTSAVSCGNDYLLFGTFKGRAEMLESSIRIKNVTRKDAGKYRCEISASTEQGQEAAEIEISLSVLVPPAVPVCEVPISAMSGTAVELRCKENEGSPASKYRWFRGGIVLPENPGSWWGKKSSSYTVNSTTGTLLFNPVSKNDTGLYYCEASNGVGRPRRCPATQMQVDDLNVSAIVAAVVIVALIIASCGLGVYYAQKKGYFSKRHSSEKMTSKYRVTHNERDFKHTKSFII